MPFKSKYHDKLMAMGYVCGTKEWENARCRLKYKNENGALENKIRKRRQRKKRGEEINEYQRKRYARSRTAEARKQNTRRIKRKPYQGIRKAIYDCERGDIGIPELVKLIRERFALSFANDPTAAGFREDVGGILGPFNETDCKEHLRHSDDKNGCN